MNEDANKPLNVAENLVADKGNMTVSTKLMKWAIGILIAGTVSVLSFSYGLYTKVESNRKEADAKQVELINANRDEILTALKELQKEEVKPNTEKNYAQDASIMLVMDRTNTLGDRVNGNYQRPPAIASQPIPSSLDLVVPSMDEIASFEHQNVVEPSEMEALPPH